MLSVRKPIVAFIVALQLILPLMHGHMLGLHASDGMHMHVAGSAGDAYAGGTTGKEIRIDAIQVGRQSFQVPGTPQVPAMPIPTAESERLIIAAHSPATDLILTIHNSYAIPIARAPPFA